ncbi:tyrosine-type recombinase/integrase, partial [Streptacidiphilus neutrinimicus]|uniref:tyrosine-type recombinase/integrase n=1 Tax=Streptacidiphilus neutrinimicus TaxID=105420 RepID=UPI0006938B94
MTDPATVEDAPGEPGEVLVGELLGDPEPSGSLLPARLDLDAFLAPTGLDAARLAELRAAAAVVEELYDAATTQATRDAYADDWDHFTAWCARYGLRALPAEPATVALYLGAHADEFAVSTLNGRLSGIAHHHTENGHHSPTRHDAVRRVKKGLARTRGKPAKKKEPLYGPLLALVVTAATVRDADGRLTLASARDRAVILLGQALADRRSELTAIHADQIEFTAEGLRIHEGRSKTNQEGKAQSKVVPFNHARRDLCPVRAVQEWMDLAGIRLDTHAPLFVSIDRWGNLRATALSPQSVNLIIKAAGRTAGLPEHLVAALAGGSLRSGLVAGAKRGGAQDSDIMDQTHHTKVSTIHGY